MLSAVALFLLLFVFVFESRLDMTTMLLLGSLIVALLGVFWYLWALNAANKRRMQALAYLDPLTGLRNWAWMQFFVGELLKKQKHKDYILVVIKMRHLRMVNGVDSKLQKLMLLVQVATKQVCLAHRLWPK